ncbi:hypothetical protein SDC9_39574 [bioreactor metagenome]|uniref:Uncharacterized protein n=1 Tax=bioreactor metagenome TaxID=1076179 RepID=A0A644VQ90_9ZZZZ
MGTINVKYMLQNGGCYARNGLNARGAWNAPAPDITFEFTLGRVFPPYAKICIINGLLCQKELKAKMRGASHLSYSESD